jgi:uncharacterized protein
MHMKKQYNIRGMHCTACEIVLERSIAKVPGVEKVAVSLKSGIAEVVFLGDAANDAAIESAVRSAGYSFGNTESAALLSRDGEEWFGFLLAAASLLIVWLLGDISGLWNSLGSISIAAPTYPAIFVIGLTAGISTCMAVVGGLVAGIAASYAKAHQHATGWQRFAPNLYFTAGRLVSYALLGGAIGALGSAVQISAGLTAFLIAAAGLVMLYLGLKLTGISPKLSQLGITIPKWAAVRLGLYGNGGEYSHRSAFLGGALTFFLPCGFTQAMQLYAVTTSSFASGGLVMLLFALGTTPGLLGIGALTSVLQGRAARHLYRFVGVAVITLGIMNIASGIRASGITVFAPAENGPLPAVSAPVANGGEQVVRMNQIANGYVPNRFTVKRGIPVKWIIDSQNAYTCAASIRMPAFGISAYLKSGQNVITFTPTQAGTYRFTCSMGMYSGSFDVID